MKKKVLVLATLVITMAATTVKAQLNVGSVAVPDASAVLQISSTTKGLRMPNVALTSTTAFAPVTTATTAAAAIGLSVYNTTAGITGTIAYPTAGVGIYTWDGTGWIVGSGKGADLRYVGNDNHISLDAGIGYTGTNAGSGYGNVGIGHQVLGSITTSTSNIGLGDYALGAVTSGKENIAIGGYALPTNSLGQDNTVVGQAAMQYATGSFNTSLGYNSLNGIGTGSNNVALGSGAGSALTSGDNNIALGSGAQLPSATGSNQMNIGNMIAGSFIDGSGTGGNIAIGHSAVVVNGSLTLDVAGITNIRKALAMGILTCPVNTGASYQITPFDVNYSIFKVTSGAYVTQLTLPSGASIATAGYAIPDGQIFRIINVANATVVINGTNTDNSASVTLVASSTAGVHAIEYIWAGNSNVWMRIQ